MRWSKLFRRTPPRKPSGKGGRLKLESLEDRWLLSYVVTDLGTLDGDQHSYANAVNNAGQAVGISGINVNAGQAFESTAGGPIGLGTLGGTGYSSAYGINDAGQVVGWSYIPNGYFSHAFLYQDGVMADLGTFGGYDSYAYGINASGQIVGQAEYPNELLRATLWENGAMTDLGSLGGYNYSFARAINDAGQIVGGSNYPGGGSLTYHAFLYQAGVMTDLGTLAGYETSSVAYAINAGGQAVGFSEFSLNFTTHDHAFEYTGGPLQDLGALPGDDDSQALGLNASGQIVGWSGNLLQGVHHAFLYQDGAMIDLNSQIRLKAGWTLTDATAINDAGQIVGFGTNPAGQTHAFLLTPTDFGTAPLQVRMDAGTAETLASHPPTGAAHEESFPVAIRPRTEPPAASSVDGAGAAGSVVARPAVAGRYATHLVLAEPDENGLSWMSGQDGAIG